MLPIDPTADHSRRAWFGCPQCNHGVGCAECQRRQNCSVHWQLLLSNQAWLLHLQCPDCGHLWSVDTNPRGRSSRGAA